MIYTIEKANLIAEQLRRFTSGYAHHVAGQFANIDFWIHEVQESIKTIDEYNKRFNNMRDEQKKMDRFSWSYSFRLLSILWTDQIIFHSYM